MTNVDSETLCLRLLIKGLIVPTRLCILSIAFIHYILFTKLPWPGDSKETFLVFQSSCHLPTCLPHTVEASQCPFNCWMSSRKAVNTNFYNFWFDQTGNRTRVYRFSSRRFIHSTTDRLLDRWSVLNHAIVFASAEVKWLVVMRGWVVRHAGN